MWVKGTYTDVTESMLVLLEAQLCEKEKTNKQINKPNQIKHN